MVTKKEIRIQMFKKRTQMTEDSFWEASNIISRKVIESDAFKRCDCIYCYIDCKGEVSTGAITQAAWQMGKRVAAPKIIGDEMLFYYIQGNEDLEPGYFGVMEPITEALALEDTSLIIVPGVAFDKSRHRVGYGKGFYDRYLFAHKRHCTIAVGFDFQVLDEVEYDVNDQLPQILITETCTY